MTESPTVQRPLDHHGGPRLRGLGAPPEPRADKGRFRWLIDGLKPLELPDATLTALAATMVDESGGGGWSGQPTAADNPALPAGYTYLAQFVDHDITFDSTSRLDRVDDAEAVSNFRTPRFDLDSIYGGGPKASPYLYNNNDQALLLIDGAPAGPRLAGLDLPRNSQERALIGDPRNDVHVIISQLHLAFVAFHNAVVSHVRSNPALRWGDESEFQTACRLVRWHYQWIVLHDLLPRIVGPETVEAVLTRTGKRYKAGLKLYNLRFKAPYIPIEFSAAAYRFGHSLVRDSYVLNSSNPSPLPLFSADAGGTDLRGFRRLPEPLRIEWERFFPGLDGAPVSPGTPASGTLQPSMRLDGRLAPSLTHPPVDVDEQRRSIALLNLFRGQALGLPGGQDFANAVGRKVGESVHVLTSDELGQPGPVPLWFYLLREAEVLGEGARLGPVGARVVAEVLIGLAMDDPSSLLQDDTGWTPVLPSATAGQFTIADLLRFAGAGPA
ncbi:Animal haem peroxidase [Blastococcus tunisiensis]|uniref:Animal haem peroxidase n=1 Tax=Blastococcus tunisiensis TaxID=1798228 RepID=A0A1I2ETV4_9ACTN|nr:Animal haem peroxidase [Blastococcus sp. DSM 46838]